MHTAQNIVAIVNSVELRKRVVLADLLPDVAHDLFALLEGLHRVVLPEKFTAVSYACVLV